MAEQVKSIIEILSKPPFDKTFNIISFDNLEPLQLLQVLNDVFSYIEPTVSNVLKLFTITSYYTSLLITHYT